MGVVPPAPGFLEALRALCDACGALLVFDEVITGFRVARGGAQERYGVTPDLTILGKIVGGGLPAAAFGGRAELMERLAPVGDVYQAGTLSGNPLATAAGHVGAAAPPRPGRLRRARAPRRAARGRPRAVRHRPARRRDADALLPGRAGARLRRRRPLATPIATAALFRHLLERGVYLAPSQFEACSSRSRTATRRSTGRSRPLATSSAADAALGDARGRGGGREPALGRLAPPAGRARARAASSRRSATARFALGVETIYEGYLLHYGRPRLFAPADADTALLLGDYLYAHGLVRIAATGSVEAVSDLAELISLCAQARADGRAARRRPGRRPRAARPRRARRGPRRRCASAASAVPLRELRPAAAGAEAVERACRAHDLRWGKVRAHDARFAPVRGGRRRGRPQGRPLDARRRA